MQVRRLFDIDRRAFTPPPKVASTVVELLPRPAPLAPADPPVLERVTAAAFGQRRKMPRQSLRALGVDPAGLLAAADIVPTRRAEELSIEAFSALARSFSALARAVSPNSPGRLGEAASCARRARVLAPCSRSTT